MHEWQKLGGIKEMHQKTICPTRNHKKLINSVVWRFDSLASFIFSYKKITWICAYVNLSFILHEVHTVNRLWYFKSRRLLQRYLNRCRYFYYSGVLKWCSSSSKSAWTKKTRNIIFCKIRIIFTYCATGRAPCLTYYSKSSWAFSPVILRTLVTRSVG